MKVSFQIWQSPLGPLFLYATEKNLIGLCFSDNRASFLKKNAQMIFNEEKSTLIKEAIKQLEEYFRNKRTQFNLPLEAQGTPFQKKAWNALQKIPYGKTISYGDQARKIRSEKSVRAVGTANGKNPIAIIIPCHRVIGSNGTLTGYAGGLSLKSKLLEIEGLKF